MAVREGIERDGYPTTAGQRKLIVPTSGIRPARRGQTGVVYVIAAADTVKVELREQFQVQRHRRRNPASFDSSLDDRLGAEMLALLWPSPARKE